MVIIQGEYEDAIRYCVHHISKDYFEFSLSYVDTNERFRELDRFLWESRHCLRFQNEFKGDTLIDLTAWNCKEAYEFNDYFDAFMFYLKSKQDKLNVTFIVSDKCSESLHQKLCRHFDLQVIEPEKGSVNIGESKVPLGFCSREN